MRRLCVAALALGLVACDMPDMGAPTDDGVGAGDMGPMVDGGPPGDEALRINQMQMRATVNSYHDFLFDFRPEEEWGHVRWRHPRLIEQVQSGIRVFDFDVAGDRVAWINIEPATVEWAGDWFNNCGVVRDGEPLIGDLRMCLWDLRDWCDAHPDHPLIVVLLGEADTFDQPSQVMWQLDDLEGYVLSGLGRERLIVPADLRGEHPSIWAAIQADGWPTIAETRGKVMIVLNDRGPIRATYLMNGGEDPADRLMFMTGDPDTAGDEAVADEVVFTFEPGVLWEFETDMAHLERMRELVDRGFLVHAITDDPEKAALLRREGVHFVGTRFPEEVFGPVGEHPTTCNPVTAPLWCRDEMFESR